MFKKEVYIYHCYVGHAHIPTCSAKVRNTHCHPSIYKQFIAKYQHDSLKGVSKYTMDTLLLKRHNKANTGPLGLFPDT